MYCSCKKKKVEIYRPRRQTFGPFEDETQYDTVETGRNKQEKKKNYKNEKKNRFNTFLVDI